MAIATKNLALDEFPLPATDQKEIGKASNNEKKATNPRRTTGSKEKSFKSESTIDKSQLRLFRKAKSYLLACFNKKQPPNIESKTGDQAANEGFIMPLTPRELKLKLKK